MKLVTAAQMRAMDKETIEKYGVPGIDLMERAGKAVVDSIEKTYKKGAVAIFVGKGNNGGDGLVVARHLIGKGFQVSIYLLSSWTEFTKSARVNWDRLADKKVSVIELVGDGDIKKHAKEFEKVVCIVDAIFGTGLSEEVKGKYKVVIEFINSLTKPVISVDVPSGLSADTGEPLGVAVHAKRTITFGLMKVGLATASHEYTHAVEVADIGFPKQVVEDAPVEHFLISKDMFAKYFGARRDISHKGDFGHVFVIGGAVGKIGAGLLSSRAALRTGSGLVTYGLPEASFTKFDTRSPEVMYEGIPDKGAGYFIKESLAHLKQQLTNKDVIAIGPGIGTETETKKIVNEIVLRSNKPIVVDADALTCLADGLNALVSVKHPLIFTPHPGEMAKLTGLSIKEIQADRINVARAFAKKYHLHLVLKGHRTIVATPDGKIFINPTGNPGMATAGMGDVLTGVIASLIGQKIPVETAVIAGVYLHGLAGDLAAKEIGERGLIASDVIAHLPKAIKCLSA